LAAVLSIDALRERIREIEGRGVEPHRVPTGVPEVDSLVGGLPVPGLVEVAGLRGSGRTRVVVAIAIRLAARRRMVAWVDPLGRLYPPGLAVLGLDLSQVLVVRPPAEQDVWACEQAARSGCFPLVVVVDPPLRRHLGARLSRAAEQGSCAIVVLSERSTRELPASVRFLVQRDQLVVVRDRQGEPGHIGQLPLRRRS
jgi:hypothetical protein